MKIRRLVTKVFPDDHWQDHCQKAIHYELIHGLPKCRMEMRLKAWKLPTHSGTLEARAFGRLQGCFQELPHGWGSGSYHAGGTECVRTAGTTKGFHAVFAVKGMTILSITPDAAT